MPLDPYYLWLGIPPSEQPPNHYRLLGVSAFESNEQVIEARGPIVKVSVNGRVLASYDLDVVSRRPGVIPGLAQPSGRIGFQSWDRVARFRNIRIEHLPAAP